MAGSRTISTNARTQIDKKAASVFYGVKVEWGGATGTKYYDDAGRTVDGISFQRRVANWGEATSSLDGSGGWSFSLRDDDGALRAIAEAGGADGKVVTLYLLWSGAAQADWVVVWKGITEARSRWDEASARFELSCIDYGQKVANAPVTTVESGDFPYADESAYGKGLPIVYGKKRGVSGVCVKGGGPVTETTTYFSEQADAGDTFYVSDATKFPSGTIDVWVGCEKIRGSFSGNCFTISDRNLLMHSGQLTFDVNTYLTVNLDTTEASGYWNGYALRMKIYDFDTSEYVGPYQYRTIRMYVNSGGDIKAVIDAPFSDGRTNDVWAASDAYLHSGYTPWKPTGNESTQLNYDITTHRVAHYVGEKVRYAPSGGTVYVVSDRPATAVHRVYALDPSGEKRVYLPEGTYTVNLDDDQFLSEIGANCTTVTFTMPPEILRVARQALAYHTDGLIMVTRTENIHGAIMVDVDGPSSDGSVIENPASIINHFATRLGLSAGEIDAASVSAAETARSDWRMAFAFDSDGARGRDILESLAKQGFLAIDWSQGTLRIVTLRNDIDVPSAAATISSNRKMDSWRREQAGIHASVTRVAARFINSAGKEREVKQTDSTALADSGLVVEQMDAWAYVHRNPVKAMCSYWLYRLRYQPDTDHAEVFLDLLDLLPGDLADIMSRRGWVSSVSVRPGATEVVDRVALDVSVPPTCWYDDSWSYPSPTYTDPPLPTSDETSPGTHEVPYQPPQPNTNVVTTTTTTTQSTTTTTQSTTTTTQSTTTTTQSTTTTTQSTTTTTQSTTTTTQSTTTTTQSTTTTTQSTTTTTQSTTTTTQSTTTTTQSTTTTTQSTTTTTQSTTTTTQSTTTTTQSTTTTTQSTTTTTQSTTTTTQSTSTTSTTSTTTSDGCDISDNFDRTEDPINTNWNHNYSNDEIRANGTKAELDCDASTACDDDCINATDIGSANQGVSVDYIDWGTDPGSHYPNVKLYARMGSNSDITQDWYDVEHHAIGSDWIVDLNKQTGGSITNIASYAPGYGAGKVRATIYENLLTAELWQNAGDTGDATDSYTVSDSDIASGNYVGLGLHTEDSGAVQVDDFCANVATSSPGYADCNSCSPGIPATLYVTLDNLKDDWANFNQKYQILWQSGCTWYAEIGGGYDIYLTWDNGGYMGDCASGHWNVDLIPGYNCRMVWEGPTDSCNPTGTDSYSVCYSSCGDCNNTDTCTDSTNAGASCVVSTS